MDYDKNEDTATCCKQIWMEILDPDFKDTFTSLSISHTTIEDGQGLFPNCDNYVVVTTSLIAGVCVWSLHPSPIGELSLFYGCL